MWTLEACATQKTMQQRETYSRPRTCQSWAQSVSSRDAGTQLSQAATADSFQESDGAIFQMKGTWSEKLTREGSNLRGRFPRPKQFHGQRQWAQPCGTKVGHSVQHSEPQTEEAPKENATKTSGDKKVAEDQSCQRHKLPNTPRRKQHSNAPF